MKWKLDENFGSRTAHLFLGAGYDAETVLQEQIGGSSDETLYAHCIREDRCLLTLDMDFADILRFPPHDTPGIAVLRVRFVAFEPIRGRLWIVEPGRVRVREDAQAKSD